MTQIFNMHKRKILAGGVLIGAYAFYDYVPLPNPFYTPGVQNIEKRYSSGGGAANHTPGTATKLGDAGNQTGNVEKEKGIGTPYYQEKYGEQKPDPSSFDKTWNQAQYHQDKGK